MFNYTSEWDPDSPGPQVVVELRESPSDSNHSSFNGTALAVDGPKLIVRAEEVLIVGFVFCIWIAAIALFFNRWGKIRMLEPYQPKFQQQHRSSCPLVDISSMSPSQRLSLPRVSITTACPKHIHPMYRPRQNSVFVGPQIITPKPPRKTRSAVDIHSLILDETGEPV